jgi:hypothetical protein
MVRPAGGKLVIYVDCGLSALTLILKLLIPTTQF